MTIDAIMIDQREPEWVQQLTFGGIPTCVTMLDHGDVLATTTDGELIAIERKTPSDFLNTLAEDRLFPQLAGLRTVTPWSYLLITGELLRGADGRVVVDRGAAGWDWRTIQGALLTVQELGTFVTFAADDADFEATVVRIGKRHRDPEMVIAPPRVARLLSPGEATIASLPGIGMERVAALFGYAGNSEAGVLCYLCDLDLNRHEHIPGIGPGIKQSVRKALGLGADQELVLIHHGDKEI